MPAPTGTVYPGALDTSTNIGSAVSSGQVIASAYADTSSSAILSIENSLGTNPQGSDATVGAALAARARKTDIQNQTLTYGADSGTANTYAVTLSPAPTAYTAGMEVAFKAANTNTGASTLNVNALGAQSLVKNGSVALASGDINAGQIYTATYDGTNFQLLGGAPASLVPHLYQANGDGTTTAFAIGFTPVFPAALLAWAGGLLQRLTTDYSYSAPGGIATVTFTTAPPSGTNNVQVWGM